MVFASCSDIEKYRHSINLLQFSSSCLLGSPKYVTFSGHFADSSMGLCFMAPLREKSGLPVNLTVSKGMDAGSTKTQGEYFCDKYLGVYAGSELTELICKASSMLLIRPLGLDKKQQQ